MNTLNLTGIVKFKVNGQAAMPKWAQQAIQNAMETAEAPPESLRFQCRIAQDARENFKEIPLDNGETLKLHPRTKPQFGKNHKGLPYLTGTFIYSGDGESYTVKWVGSAVPSKMPEVAVKHDKGLRVGSATVALDLSKAQITRSMHSEYSKRYKENNPEARAESNKRYQESIKGRAPKKKRVCARWTEEDARQAVAA